MPITQYSKYISRCRQSIYYTRVIIIRTIRPNDAIQVRHKILPLHTSFRPKFPPLSHSPVRSQKDSYFVGTKLQSKNDIFKL